MSAIATDRLSGRPCTPEDRDLVAALFADGEVRRWTTPPGLLWSPARVESVTMKLAAHWVAHGWGPRLWFEQGRFAGIAGLQFAVIGGRGVVEIAYALMPPARGRGLAGEAVAAILAEAPGIAREIVAALRPGNAPSLRLLARAGFEPAPGIVEDGEPLDIQLRRFP